MKINNFFQGGDRSEPVDPLEACKPGPAPTVQLGAAARRAEPKEAKNGSVSVKTKVQSGMFSCACAGLWHFSS